MTQLIQASWGVTSNYTLSPESAESSIVFTVLWVCVWIVSVGILMGAVCCFWIYGFLFPFQWQCERFVLRSETENAPLRHELPAPRPLMDFIIRTARLSWFITFFDHLIWFLSSGEDGDAFWYWRRLAISTGFIHCCCLEICPTSLW